jgi:hypothetical protein
VRERVENRRSTHCEDAFADVQDSGMTTIFMVR